MAPNQARTMTRPYRATSAAMAVVWELLSSSAMMSVARLCDMLSPFASHCAPVALSNTLCLVHTEG